MEEYFGFEPGKIAEETNNGKSSGFKQFKKKFPKKQEEKVAIRKEVRKKKQERKKRLIIRNLSFKVNEEELKKEFSKFGDVVDVNIPKKPDGKMRGFAFVQYKSFQSAIEAVRNLNYQKLKGRPIAVDYAIAKDKYQHITSAKHTTNNLSQEPKEDDEKNSEESDSEVEKADSDANDDDDSKSDPGKKSEEESVSDTADDHVKKFLKEFNADQESLQDAGHESEKSCSDSDSLSESDDDSSHFKKSHNAKEEEEEEDDDDDDMDSEIETDTLKKRKGSVVSGEEPLPKKKNRSDDINEGKTVFIRNVSFDTDQDSLKTTMETFGPIKYCLLVIDKFTDLPRGTAFVKFENKEDADKVIQKSSENDPEGIYLDGRKLCCTLAISREELQTRNESDTKTGKDKRNLSLLKVGLIKKGSVEAEGVSQSDLTKRAKLEILKRSKLKNLQFFVSDKRLCVHNIPSYYSDAELRKLFKNAAGPGAKVTEVRIMRNFKKVNAQGIAESKGFGFVSLEKHDDALKALMAINNNPDAFSSQQRPIVEFSVENMNALLMKKRRKERSMLKAKKDIGHSDANQTEEESLTSLKFSKRNVDMKNMETRKKFQGKNNFSKNSQNKTSKLKKNKMENKMNRERKLPLVRRKQFANNSFMKENPEKKKNKKHQKKNRSLSEGLNNDKFIQMVDKYKQKLSEM